MYVAKEGSSSRRTAFREVVQPLNRLVPVLTCGVPHRVREPKRGIPKHCARIPQLGLLLRVVERVRRAFRLLTFVVFQVGPGPCARDASPRQSRYSASNEVPVKPRCFRSVVIRAKPRLSGPDIPCQQLECFTLGFGVEWMTSRGLRDYDSHSNCWTA